MITRTLNNSNFFNFINNYNSEKIGLYFSFFLHLLLLMFIIGIPNFFQPSPIIVPTIIPIEIINVSEVTSVTEKNEETKNITENTSAPESKKFNNAEPQLNKNVKIKSKPKNDTVKFNNIESQLNKSIEIKSKPKIDTNNSVILKNIEKKEKVIKQNDKATIKLNTNQKILQEERIESLPTKKIKPKIKPKPNLIEDKNDLSKNVEIKIKKKIIDNNNANTSDISVTIKPKPKPSFDIASMLKDLRNDQTSIQNKQKNKSKLENKKDSKNEELNDDIAQLSISEIDLLIQQLSSCWSAPAGAVIKKGMVVKISAKIKPDRNVLIGSVRIVDTNIPQNNPFYGPITESAMRTLLNPECSPLKLPMKKYDLWKNLTIIFDHSIMKGY